MGYRSVYDDGIRAKARQARAESLGKPAPTRTRHDRLKATFAENETIAEGHVLGRFFSEWIEGGIDDADRRSRSASVSEFFDRNPSALYAVEAADRIVRASVWEEKEKQVREMIGPLYNRAGRAGKDPIANIAAQMKKGGGVTMHRELIEASDLLRNIFSNIEGAVVASMDLSQPKVDTSLNAKRDWMPVSRSLQEIAWNDLARISDVVGEERLLIMVRVAVFWEPVAYVALFLEDDEAALANGKARQATCKAATSLLRGGLRKMLKIPLAHMIGLL